MWGFIVEKKMYLKWEILAPWNSTPWLQLSIPGNNFGPPAWSIMMTFCNYESKKPNFINQLMI